MDKQKEYYLPDGGFGWIIVFASALNNCINVPIMQVFGMIFEETFTSIHLSATKASFIVNLNLAFGMITGFINGPLLKRFGYRKVSLLSAFLVTSGIILTAFSKNFAGYVISYGIITSLGMGLAVSSYSLAVNSYFKQKRSKAIAMSATITALGSILMPLLTNFLLNTYTPRRAVLIIGALSLHSFFSAGLLQPAKWHWRFKTDKPLKALVLGDDDEECNIEEKCGAEKSPSNISSTVINEVNDIEITNKDDLLEQSKSYFQYTKDVLNSDDTNYGVLEGSSSLISDEQENKAITSLVPEKELESTSLSDKPRTPWIIMMEYMDLDLLKDPKYLSLMIGLSVSLFSEYTFAVLIAFMLANFGFEIDQIAVYFTIVATFSIIFRFLSPVITKVLKKSSKEMYIISLSLLGICRFGLIYFHDYCVILTISAVLGMAKGLRAVNMSLVMPDYVPLEKLGSATGLQMMLNGILTVVGGPLLGLLKDWTGSYKYCIVIMNFLTFTVVIVWAVEMKYFRIKERKDSLEKSAK